MKKLILLLLILYIELFAQSEYNIELKKIYCEWLDFKSMSDSVETVIRDINGNIIPPSNEFYYEYHAITNDLVHPPSEDIFGGLGLNKTFEDNDYNFIQTWYVVVKNPNQTIIYGTSNTVEFRMETEQNEAKGIIFHSLKSNGNNEPGVHLEHWMYVVDLWNLNFTGSSNYLTQYYSEVLRSSPGFLSNNNDKFHYWNSNETSVLNYNSFYYTNSITEDLIANYKTVVGATIRVKVDNLYLDVLKFKDPWLRDFNDPPYGLRNQGLLAQPQPLNNVNNNLSIISSHQGVLIDQPIAPEHPYYSISIPSSTYLPLTGQTHILYLQSWDVSPPGSADLDNYTSLAPNIIFHDDGATITANVKGTGLSNDLNAYYTTSQRKFVKTNDGFLHYVYESLGKVWYELSTDAGSSWNIMNNGQTLGDGKSPSIDYLNNFVLIAYQGDGTVYVECFSRNEYTNTYDLTNTLFVDEFVEGMDNAQNSYPVISTGGGGYSEGYFFILAWRIYQGETPHGQPYGLFCKLGQVFPPYYSISWANASQLIPGTNSTSQNPSMAVNKVDENVGHNLVWQQGSAINHIMLTPVFTPPQVTFGSPTTYTAHCPFKYNVYPSISLTGSAYVPIVSWVGHNDTQPGKIIPKETGSSPSGVTQAVTRRGPTGNFSITGRNVNYVNNNSTSEADENTVIVWSEGNPAVSKWNRRSSGEYTPTLPLDYSGIQTQVSNGACLSALKAMVYNTGITPYYFTFDNENFTEGGTEPPGGGKITNSIALTYGRSGIVGKNGVNFVFNIGDIILADTNVQFIPRPDTLLYTSTDELNQVTRSLTYHLDNQSELYFTNFYYTVNSDLADSALTSEDAVTFRAELVNANTNAIEGIFDEITYTRDNLQEYDNINYRIDCLGIEEGDYYIRLVTSVAGEAEYNLANVQNDDPGLEKRNYKNVSYSGSETPITYAIFQNYPNPFNPSTIINYQLPKSGFVTLKVYDILGREVATLVNEEKSQGSYSVNFSASKFASGVYIYQIRANDYVYSKKMMLLK